MAGIWLASQILGFYGAALVVYGFVASVSSPWVFLEHTAPFVSSVLTILAVLLTCASVYLPKIPYCAPWRLSRWLVAPLVMLSCVGALIMLAISGQLPLVLMNGLAMLGLAGGLLRILQINVHEII